MDRLAKLEATEGIRRLIALYAQLLDSHRYDEWGQLFSEDAEFSVGPLTYRGRAEIQREICGMMRPEIATKHMLVQPVIEFEGPTRALAWTDMAGLATDEAGIARANLSPYHDRLVFEEECWRFAARALLIAGDELPAGVAQSPGA